MTHLPFYRFLLAALLLATGAEALQAQPAGQVGPQVADTVSRVLQASPAIDTSLSFFNRQFAGIAVNGPLVYRLEQGFVPLSNDHMFYAAGLLLLLLGIIRTGFSKYYADLLRIFGQTTFRQKSIREQLLQNRLASLFMNFFFFLSAGFFVYQLAGYYRWNLPALWWQQLLFCMAFVAVLYSVKYIGLQVSGWLFGLRELAETYTFMVFLINKVVGVLLLPASLVLALGAANLKPVFVTVSVVGLAALFIYRYIIALPLLRQHVKVIPIHFFLYFCAFEIIPVLLVYKWTVSIIRA